MNGKIILVTGGAGFIGTNFVKLLSERFSDSKIVVVDLLTYAGNIGNIKDLIDLEKITFIQVDISDSQKVFDVFDKYSFDYVVNFAAESHVDRSILNSRKFIETNVLGTQPMKYTVRLIRVILVKKPLLILIVLILPLKHQLTFW